MSGNTLNVTKYLKAQGLDKDMIYRAVVTNNDDKRQLGRIKARVEGIFEGIEDDHLPWANPEFRHLQGAFNAGLGMGVADAASSTAGGAATGSSGKFGILGPNNGKFGLAIDRSGIFHAPKVDQVVGLKFPTGDPHKPIWTSYTSDEATALPEVEENYPNRVVVKLANGFYVIIDTETNEMFINNPGDVNMTILGDCNQFIVGNQQIKVVEEKTLIAPYLLMAPDTVLKDLEPTPVKKIPFESALGGEKGNRHVHVDGNQTYTIVGHRFTTIGGSDITNVKLFRATNVTIMDMTNSIRIEHNTL